MSDNKHKLNDTAETLDEVAAFADYLRVLALGADELDKAERIEEQAGVLRGYAGIYRLAADNA